MYRIFVHQLFWQFSALLSRYAESSGPEPIYLASVAVIKMVIMQGGVNLRNNSKYILLRISYSVCPSSASMRKASRTRIFSLDNKMAELLRKTTDRVRHILMADVVKLQPE
jgi:hypothetical protein